MERAVAIHPVENRRELEESLAPGVVVLYKHSPTCWVAARALEQVERFAQKSPGIPIYMVDVIGQRPLSDWVAEHFGIAHESPQAIVLRDGEPVWHASHFSVTARALRKAAEAA
ncbi:MAG: bacillithiol system redox-active protein YtxJ [Gemmatimonadota bacterium]